MDDSTDRQGESEVAPHARETIALSAALVDEIVGLLVEALPHEGCGVVGMTGHEVTRVYPIRNVSPSATSYTLNPTELVQALRTAHDEDAPIGGLFHSHPEGAPYPSSVDLATDVDRAWVHLIVALSGELSVIRAFRFGIDGVTRVDIVRPPNPPAH